MIKTYHPQVGGNINRVSYIIKHMIRMYVMDQPFAYSTGYHAYLKMSPFQAINIREWNTPTCQDRLLDKVIIGK